MRLAKIGMAHGIAELAYIGTVPLDMWTQICHTMPSNASKICTQLPTEPQHTPLRPAPRKYGAAAQDPEPPDTSQPLDAKDKNLLNAL